MSSVIPKLYHKILAKRLETYLLKNYIIDPSIQKGFLTGINGTTEHTLTTTAIIDNAIQHGNALAVTFLDLQNAFGSVAHTLIKDIFIHVKLPEALISYISNGYSKLTASVRTKEWRTSTFEIKRGVFQEDTLSPVIFLTVFNPLIMLSKQLNTSGFSLTVPIPNSVGLPPINSSIYVYWNECPSDEPVGWYYAVVKEHLPDGTTCIEYANKATETVNLYSVQWEPTRKGQKPYLSTNSKPPQFPLKKIRSEISKSKYFNSTQHSAKAFADDLSVFSSSIKDHHSLLLAIDDKCSDLDLTLKPEKCVSIVFNGVKMDHTMSFPLKNGPTRNIANVPTKVLGKLMAVSTSQTKSAASSKLEKRAIKKIDERPIRGEYKVWIWKNYLAPSLHFQLMVDLLKKDSVNKIQSKVT